MQLPSDIFWIALIVGGIVAIAAGLRYAVRAKETESWPIATASITRSAAVRSEARESQEFGVSHYLVVDYAYAFEVKGSHTTVSKTEKFLTNAKTIRNRTGEDWDKAEDFRRRNPVGKRFMVLYDPGNHDKVLEKGPANENESYGGSWMGVVAIVIGVTLLIFDTEWYVPSVIAAIGGGVLGGLLANDPFDRKSPFDLGPESLHSPHWDQPTVGAR